MVTVNFLPTLGVRLREGRFFSDSDGPASQPVVIINDTFANRHWAGQSPLGKRITISGERDRWLTIAGVAKEVRERGINIEMAAGVYMPVRQSERYWPVPADLAIRTAVDPSSITSAVRAALASVDRDQPLSDIRSMGEVVDLELSDQKQQMWLLSAFAGLALTLAATGIYGVISYLVSQRRREIGVRMALGATPGAILRMVFQRGAGLLIAGVLAGVVLALAASRLIASMLFGVRRRCHHACRRVAVPSAHRGRCVHHPGPQRSPARSRSRAQGRMKNWSSSAGVELAGEQF